MDNIKDNLANATTVAASGAVIMDFNEILTLVLITTGIILNIVRIMAVKKKEREDKE